MGVPDQPGGLEPVHLGHADVDQRDVGSLAFDEVEQLLAVGGLADDLDAVGHVQVATQPLTHEGVIVRDRDSDRHARWTLLVWRSRSSYMSATTGQKM